jgi:alpha-L-arabinofuranosidase
VSRTILYAELIGIMGINRDQVVYSPVADMLQLYATHERCDSLSVDVDTDTFDVPPKAGFAGATGAPYVDVSARRHPDGSVDVFLVNRSLTSNIPVTLAAAGGAPVREARVSMLAADKLVAWNTFANPNRVSVQNSSVTPEDGKLHIVLPPYSVVRLTW